MKPSTALDFIKSKLFLFALIFVGVAMAGARMGDAWTSITSGKMFMAMESAFASAPAAAENQPKETKPAPDAKSEKEKAAPATPENKDSKKTGGAEEQHFPRTQPPPSVPSSGDAAGGNELLKQLSARREQLDKRERDMNTREALIKVAEQRVDQKIREMETLRAQLQSMVNQASGAQQAQMDNLVKIYETMKPKEAAKIFEALEMPVLLGVVKRMKPQRTAAVMAELPPEKAKDLTVAITKQDQLPQIK